MTTAVQPEPCGNPAPCLPPLNLRECNWELLSTISTGTRDFSFAPTVARLQPAIGSSGERGSMARRRYQKGQLWKEAGVWHGRWREDAYGTRKRIRHHEVVGTTRDFPTKRLAQRALDERIAHVNRVTYRPRP